MQIGPEPFDARNEMLNQRLVFPSSHLVSHWI